jgi:hypothetical protein
MSAQRYGGQARSQLRVCVPTKTASVRSPSSKPQPPRQKPPELDRHPLQRFQRRSDQSLRRAPGEAPWTKPRALSPQLPKLAIGRPS